MDIAIFLVGLVMGYFFSVVIKKLSTMVINRENPQRHINGESSRKLEKCNRFTTRDIIVILISGVLFIISFWQIGLNVIFIQALVLNSILVIVSFIDIEHKIIPNIIIIFTLVIGIFFSFIDDISFINALGGMLLGGGLLLLLALVPGVLGGGDIKLMFVLGIFLGVKLVLVALFLAFFVASIISILLLCFKIKKRKDYVPFGPFLAIGSFIAFHFFY